MQRKNLTKAVLFGEQESYDIIMSLFDEDYHGWLFEVITDYEGIPFVQEFPDSNKHKEKLINELDKLDKTKPYTNDYVFTLFINPEAGWRSRGNPYVWQAISREFSNDKISMTKEAFRNKYILAYEKITSRKFDDTAEYFYDSKFAHGGISSGVITQVFFKDMLDIIIKKVEHL